MVKQLGHTGIFAAAIHGNKSQQARQKHLKTLKSKVRVLIATDIAARGIDIDELSFVINYELPNVRKHMFTELAEQVELEWKEKQFHFAMRMNVRI